MTDTQKWDSAVQWPRIGERYVKLLLLSFCDPVRRQRLLHVQTTTTSLSYQQIAQYLAGGDVGTILTTK